MSIQIAYTQRARGQIEEKSTWWRANRSKAPYLFDDELDRVLALLRERPEIGAPYKHRIQGVRKMRIWKTPYLVFYRYDPQQRVVEIMSVRSGMTKGKPKLGRK